MRLDAEQRDAIRQEETRFVHDLQCASPDVALKVLRRIVRNAKHVDGWTLANMLDAETERLLKGLRKRTRRQ